MSSLEERYGALQAKTALLVQKYREQESRRAEAEEALQAKEQLVALLLSERESEREEAAGRLRELEGKLAAAERRARAAELREEERTTRLHVLLGRLRARHEDSADGEDGEAAAGADGEEGPDSGTEDSSETTGQSDSGEDEESSAPRAPARPAWMEEAGTAEEAQQRRRLASPETQRHSGADKKKQLQGMLRRGAVFKENSSKDKLAGSPSASPAPVSLPAVAVTTPPPGGSPRTASPAAAAATPSTPLSPKKKKGHLELNTIIAALTPKNRRKEDSGGVAEVPATAKSPRSGTVTRAARSRSTDRSPFLRRATRSGAEAGLAASVSAGALPSQSGGTTPRRPPTLEGELLVERQAHEMRALEITVYQAVNLEELAGKTVRVETDPAMPWPLRTRAMAVADEAVGVVFADEWQILGDRRATAHRTPLLARLVATDARGREDLAGLLEVPMQETEWNDATWTSMRWVPVTGALGEVRGLVQVILRRTTVLSEHQFVSAAATQAAVAQLLAHSLAGAVAEQLRAPPPPEDGRGGGGGTAGGGQSAVQRAMESRDLEELGRALEGGAHFEVEWRNAWRQSVLHLLAGGGRAALCRLVLTLGAKVNASDCHGNTPLHCAAHGGHWDAALLLVTRGANVAALNGVSASPLLLALLAEQLPPPELLRQLLTPAVAAARADGGLTLLHAVARLGGRQPLERLLELARAAVAAGCPADAADDDGCSPALMWALVGPLAGGAAEAFFEALGLEAGERQRVWLRAEQRGDTPLWRLLATEPDAAGEERALELLRAADIDRRYGLHGNTLLQRACASLPPERAVRLGMLLLDTRPELDAAAANATHRHTALHLLCARGDDALVPLARRLLEDHRADANGRDAAGRTPLHYCGSPSMARLLLVHGARLDAVDAGGNTVLHMAHAWGSQALVDLLLSALKRDDPPALRQANAEGLLPHQLVAARHKLICSPFYPTDPAVRRTNGIYWEPAAERAKTE